MSTLTVTNTNLNHAGEGVASQGNAGINLVATGTANVKLVVSGGQIINNAAAGILVYRRLRHDRTDGHRRRRHGQFAPPVDPTGATWGNGVGTNFGINISSTGTSIQRHMDQQRPARLHGHRSERRRRRQRDRLCSLRHRHLRHHDHQQHDRAGRSASFGQRELLRHRRRHPGLGDRQGERQQQHHPQYRPQRHLHPNPRPQRGRRQLDDGSDGQEQHRRPDQRRRRLPLRRGTQSGGDARHPHREPATTAFCASTSRTTAPTGSAATRITWSASATPRPSPWNVSTGNTADDTNIQNFIVAQNPSPAGQTARATTRPPTPLSPTGRSRTRHCHCCLRRLRQPVHAGALAALGQKKSSALGYIGMLA